MSRSRRGAFRPTPSTRSRSRTAGPSRSRASGRSATARARASSVCILDSGIERGHPLVGQVERAVAIEVGDDDEPIVVRGRGGRPLRARDGLRRDRARARAEGCSLVSVRVLGAGYTGSGPGSAGRPALGDRAGVRRDQHEPLDHEAAVRRPPARARGQRVLQADGPRRLGAQHAGRELPVAVLVGHLRGQPRRQPIRSPTTTTPSRRSSSSPAAWGSTSPGSDGGELRVTGNSFATPHIRVSARSCSARIPS